MIVIDDEHEHENEHDEDENEDENEHDDNHIGIAHTSTRRAVRQG